ncbi:MAG: PhzF family phenazine biosynthesis protein [Phycisphaerales bacterium]
MSIPIFHVDAFTDRRFAGNPAAVCLLVEPGDPAWMQDVAAEMNLSETAFLVPRPDGFDLRWFTPRIEVDLCGHATLASAHVLWEQAYLDPLSEARFHTRASGVLTARRAGEWIELDFPTCPPTECSPPAALLEGLGVEPVWVGRHGKNHLVEVDSEQTVRDLRPDFSNFGELDTGVIVTSRSDDDRYDFVSRYFATVFGIDEDPVTGSAHCYLGPYWQQRLGRDTFTAYQASERGGVVKVTVEGERTRLGGQAVTVIRGELETTPVVVPA